MEGVSFSATTDKRKGIRLDPRTKLILLLTVTTLMFSTSNEGIMNFVKPVLSLIPFVLILSERRFKTAGKYLLFISRLLCTGTHSADDIKRSAVLCGFGDDIHYDAVCPWYYDGGLAAFLHLSQ